MLGAVKAHRRKLSIPFEKKRPNCQGKFLRLSVGLGEKMFARQMVSGMELRKWINLGGMKQNGAE